MSQTLDILSKEKQIARLDSIILVSESIEDKQGVYESYKYLIKQSIPNTYDKLEKRKAYLVEAVNKDRKNPNSIRNVKMALEKIKRNKSDKAKCQLILDPLRPEKITDSRLSKKVKKLRAKYNDSQVSP